MTTLKLEVNEKGLCQFMAKGDMVEMSFMITQLMENQPVLKQIFEAALVGVGDVDGTRKILRMMVDHKNQ